MKTHRSLIINCVLVGAALLLSGCSEPYMHRQDRIAASAGDAVEANKVLHIVDPWPRDSFRGSSASGRRVEPSMERYNRPGQGSSPARAVSPSTASAVVSQ